MHFFLLLLLLIGNYLLLCVLLFLVSPIQMLLLFLFWFSFSRLLHHFKSAILFAVGVSVRFVFFFFLIIFIKKNLGSCSVKTFLLMPKRNKRKNSHIFHMKRKTWKFFLLPQFRHFPSSTKSMWFIQVNAFHSQVAYVCLTHSNRITKTKQTKWSFVECFLLCLGCSQIYHQ